MTVKIHETFKTLQDAEDFINIYRNMFPYMGYETRIQLRLTPTSFDVVGTRRSSAD